MSEATQAGLSENAQGAIAYLTFIPAVVFLATPPYNQSPSTRFHSWQSIFLTVAAIAFWVVYAMVRLAFSMLFSLFFIFMFISLACWLGWFLIWLYCVMNALNGKRVSLPVIGPLAAKQAGI